VAGPHQQQCLLQFLFGEVQLAAQGGQFPLRDQFQPVAGDQQRIGEPRRIGGQHPQLQGHAFAHVAGAHAQRVEGLHHLEHVADFVVACLDLGLECGGNGVEWFGEVAIVADRVNDRATDVAFALAQLRKLQLPLQMAVQRLAATVLHFLLAVFVVAAPGVVARCGGGFIPAVVDDLDAGFLFAVYALTVAVVVTAGDGSD
jgi:hypothetical protein